MSIDLSSETLESLSDLAAWERIPRRRRGKKLHVSTLFRWASRGCRGVKLETTRVGGTLCSSKDALQRFFDRLSANDQQAELRAPGTPRQRAAAICRAERELNND